MDRRFWLGKWGAVGVLACMASACNKATTPDPAEVAVTRTPHMVLEGRERVTTVGPHLISLEPEKGVVNVWKWGDLKPRPETMNLGATAFEAQLAGDLKSFLAYETEPNALVLKRATPAETIKSWPLEKEWFCKALKCEPGGRYGTVVLEEDLAVTSNFDKPRIRLGLWDTSTGELTWPFTLTGSSLGQSSIRAAVPSHRGGYLAVTAWQNQGAMVDVAARKLLWTISLLDSTFYSAAFSPDDKTLYTPLSYQSVLVALDTVSGKELRRWPADVDYGRFVSVAVSGDGKWAAAGGEGDVCVWSLETGRVALHLRTTCAVVYNVAFSPDSSLLATSGTLGSVQIWKMPK